MSGMTGLAPEIWKFCRVRGAKEPVTQGAGFMPWVCVGVKIRRRSGYTDTERNREDRLTCHGAFS